MTTREQLDALHAAATPGEWTRHDTGTLAGIAEGAVDDGEWIGPNVKAKRICYMNRCDAHAAANLDIICTLHNAWPPISAKLALLEEIIGDMNGYGITSVSKCIEWREKYRELEKES